MLGRFLTERKGTSSHFPHTRSTHAIGSRCHDADVFCFCYFVSFFSICWHRVRIRSSNCGSWAQVVVWLHTLVQAQQANRSTILRPFSITAKTTSYFRTRRRPRCARGTHGTHPACIWCHWVTMDRCDTLSIHQHIRHFWRARMIFALDSGSDASHKTSRRKINLFLRNVLKLYWLLWSSRRREIE